MVCQKSNIFGSGHFFKKYEPTAPFRQRSAGSYPWWLRKSKFSKSWELWKNRFRLKLPWWLQATLIWISTWKSLKKFRNVFSVRIFIDFMYFHRNLAENIDFRAVRRFGSLWVISRAQFRSGIQKRGCYRLKVSRNIDFLRKLVKMSHFHQFSSMLEISIFEQWYVKGCLGCVF